MNDALERIWKDVVVAYFEVLSTHFPGETEETHEKLTGLWAEI
jgi:hypothetical protein